MDNRIFLMQIIFSVITAVLAIVAVIISVAQIHKSNKQALFDRRLNALLTVKWMLELCKNKVIKDYLEKLQDNQLTSMNQFFKEMTNSRFFEEIQDIFDNILNITYKRMFMRKLEELRSLVKEIVLIFPKNIGYEMADFVYYYSEMLVFIYKYQNSYDSMINMRNKQKESTGDNSNIYSLWKNMMRYSNGTFTLAERLEKGFVLQKVEAKIKL